MTAPAEWPTLEPLALHGLAADVVEALYPHTEADRPAMLLSFLTMFGSAVGPKPHARVGADIHPARLNTAIVGETSRARKGSGHSMVRAVMQSADPDWAKRIVSGFGSGERVIDEVTDHVSEEEEPRDRRLLIREPELARVYTVAGRETSILSMVMREAWDGSQMSVRTRGSTVTATDAHISVLGDITVAELRRTLPSTELVNGGANRFNYALTHRSKRLPSGGNLDDAEVAHLGAKVAVALAFAKKQQRMHRTPTAETIWAGIYDAVNDEEDGLFGAVTARGEAIMLRLSLVYALLDQRREIDVEHVRAAVALWSYCEQSARFIFDPRSTGDEIADKLFAALVTAGDDGLTGTEINNLFGGHVTAKRLQIARDFLSARELITTVKQPSGGRSSERVFVAEEAEEAEKVRRLTFADRVREFLLPLSPLNPHVDNRELDRCAPSNW